MIDQSQIDYIKKTADLSAIIRGSGVELKRKGNQLAGLCPFHDDHTPSLIVDTKKRLWNCLGKCNEGGDVYEWVMKTKGLTFPEAHALLIGGIGNHESAVDVYANKKWLELAVAHYHRKFLETPSAQDYLKSRGIKSSEIVMALRIGYVDGSLLDVVSPEGFTALKQIGLVTEGGRELMRGCVVFPLEDARSKEVVSLYGRHSSDKNSVKHLYLPGPRRGVFNPAGSKNTDDVIVTESIIDACALLDSGVRNVIPAYGTNGLTDEIINHLNECRVKRVVLMLDNDEPGREAVYRMSEILNDKGFIVRDVVLPKKDASEFIANGGSIDAIRELLKEKEEAGNQVGIELEKHEDGSLRGSIETREYRVRGLTSSGFDRMKVNVRVNVGGAFHLDTVDLCQLRGRASFAATAGKLCRVDENRILADLGLLIDALESERMNMKQPTNDNAVAMSETDKETAINFLRDPNLIDHIVEDFKRCGLEGERATMLTAYLSAISRKLQEPYCVLVIARSGAGKSALQDAVCGFVPPEELVRVTRLTGQALFYKDPDSLKYKLLCIAEEEGAIQAAYSLRTLASDQYLSIAATRTDPNSGKLITEHYQVNGPVSIMITTTSPEAFDEETRSRFVQLTLDESREQTQAILERQRWNYSREGINERGIAENVKRIHHNAQRLMKVKGVINPYFRDLRYPQDRLILRREQKKYLSLIASITILHQYQREIERGESPDGIGQVEYAVVEPEDIALANELAQAALSRALDELAPPVRGMYEEIKRLCEEHAKAKGCEPDEIQLTRREIRQETGWSDWQVRTYCTVLVDLEYLYVVGGANGKTFCYQLAYYGTGNDARPLFRDLADPEQLKQLKEKRNLAVQNPHLAVTKPYLEEPCGFETARLSN